jgi:choline dehydrogenase-like flavoprotein
MGLSCQIHKRSSRSRQCLVPASVHAGRLCHTQCHDVRDVIITVHCFNASFFLFKTEASQLTFSSSARTTYRSNHNNSGLYSFPDYWDSLAAITGDDEFAEDKMRERFMRMEKNEYVKEGGKNAEGHGFDGWLSTSYGIPLVLNTIFQSTLGKLLLGFIGDINAPGSNSQEGLHAVPTTVSTSAGSTRSSVYNLIKETMTAANSKLTVRPNSFVTKILLQPSSMGPVAYGVQVQEGQALYDASTKPQVVGAARTYYARKEVIVSGGAFNTPQILQLSGVGPVSELGRLGITVLVDSPGVGSNLREKLESTVNHNLLGLGLFSESTSKILETTTLAAAAAAAAADDIHGQQLAGGAAGSLGKVFMYLLSMI